jgi:hypothetical protein
MRNGLVYILTFLLGIGVFAQSDINQLEYFIDIDPGVGSATPIVWSVAETIDDVVSIPSSSMAQGFHVIGVRAHSTTGEWGLTTTTPVYVANNRTTVVENITNIEYFIDTDPGVGNGTPVTFTAGTDIDLVESIAMSAVPQGFHTLSIRSRDALGNWGILNTVPFYMTTTSVTNISDIISVEYFFDTDPGVGNGITLDVPDASTVDFATTIDPSGLNKGFHQIGFRALSADNVWSTQELRQFYFDGSNINTDVSAIEYFFDIDPGYGNGTELLLTPQQNIDSVITFMTNTLDTGSYLIGIRPRTTDSTWGLTEYHQFLIDNLNECQRDSIALVAIYDSLDGQNWAKADGWLLDPISTWEGITITGCRVTGINLNGMGLSGTIPEEISNLTALSDLDLSNSQLGELPNAILQDTSLQTLLLSNSGLSSLPNLDTLPNLATLHVDNNALDFADLENAYGSYTLVAEPQANLSADTTITVTNGEHLSIGVGVNGNNNLFQWYKENVAMFITSDSIHFSPITKSDTGTYHIEIQNSLVAGVTLYTGTITVIVDDSAASVITDTGSTTTDPIAFFAYADLLALNPGCSPNTAIVTTTGLGTIELRNDSIIFTPTPGALGTDTLSFIASNLCGQTVQDTIVVVVTNSDPEFIYLDDDLEVSSGDFFSIDLNTAVFDFNSNEDLSSLQIITQPISGEVAILNGTTLEIDYRNSLFEGRDSLAIAVCDSLNACDTITIAINFTYDIDVRNLVTPNGDGVNDNLIIQNIQRYAETNSVRLFTKWGDLIYTANGYDNEDVSFKGLMKTEVDSEEEGQVPSGTYYYIIELNLDDKDDPCLDKQNEDFDCEGFIILVNE